MKRLEPKISRFRPPPQPSPASGRGSLASDRRKIPRATLLPLPLAGEGWGGGRKLCVLFAFTLQVLATPIYAQNAPQVLAPPIETPPSVAPVPPPIPVLEPRPFVWRELSFDLPTSIKIYQGDAVNLDGQIVRAWYADIDYNDAAIQARAILSDSKIGREPVSVLATKNAALVAINGGYFDMKSNPSKTYSLVLSDGKVLGD